ncbi:MAG TPA: helix-turn-helix domain-containing protein [Thermoleophilaceae bacterium]
MAAGRTNRSAGERREDVLEAAVTEFAAHGYRGASTAAIAKRAGISQSYVYALFPDKRALFLAAYERVGDHLRGVFARAAASRRSPRDRLRAMGAAYDELLASRNELLFRFQALAASHEPSLRAPVRAQFMRTVEEIERLSGAPRAEVARFTAIGMLMNVVAVLDLPDDYRPRPW